MIDPVLKPLLIIGSILGGVLILVGLWPEDSTETPKSTTKEPEGLASPPEFDVVEIRRLRKELRHQISAKKRFFQSQSPVLEVDPNESNKK